MMELKLENEVAAGLGRKLGEDTGDA